MGILKSIIDPLDAQLAAEEPKVADHRLEKIVNEDPQHDQLHADLVPVVLVALQWHLALPGVVRPVDLGLHFLPESGAVHFVGLVVLPALEAQTKLMDGPWSELLEL